MPCSHVGFFLMTFGSFHKVCVTSEFGFTWILGVNNFLSLKWCSSRLVRWYIGMFVGLVYVRASPLVWQMTSHP